MDQNLYKSVDGCSSRLAGLNDLGERLALFSANPATGMELARIAFTAFGPRRSLGKAYWFRIRSKPVLHELTKRIVLSGIAMVYEEAVRTAGVSNGEGDHFAKG